MAKRAAWIEQVESVAFRRGGATFREMYLDAKMALEPLIEAAKTAQDSVGREWAVVASCRSLEVSMKSFYAHAVERFSSEPETIEPLLMEADFSPPLLSRIAGRKFSLADVVYNSLRISSMEAYSRLGNKLFTALARTNVSFPWDYIDLHGGSKEYRKEVSDRLQRLSDAFNRRHQVVHELPVLDSLDIPASEVVQIVEDAIWLLKTFERQYWDIEFSKPDLFHLYKVNNVHDAIEAAKAAVERQLAVLLATIPERRHDQCRAFVSAQIDALFRRADFEGSRLMRDSFEVSAPTFVELLIELELDLKQAIQRERYCVSRWPDQMQIAEIEAQIRE